MTGHCKGTVVPMSKVDQWQLDLDGCVPADDSIQVWRSVLESDWHENSFSIARVSASVPSLAPASIFVNFKILSHGSLVYYHKINFSLLSGLFTFASPIIS